MSTQERQIYELTRKVSKNIVDNITSTRQMKEYVNILQAIMRLRQICCHRALLADDTGAPPETIVNGGSSQSNAINVEELDLQVKKPLTATQAYQLFDLMKEAGETTCTGCRRDLALPAATGEKEPSKQVLGYLSPCAHPLCHSCLETFKGYIPGFREGMVTSCPVCSALAEMRFFELREREGVEVKRNGRKKFQLDGSDGVEPSSKLQVLMNDLDALQERSQSLEKPLKRFVWRYS
jgi:SNF2 family DNA or RNA helicase